MHKTIAAVVPVYNPEPGLVALCEGLCVEFGLVIVVNDGSNENVADFKRLPQSVLVLNHEVNWGKGRAIKTALDWINRDAPQISTVVFADGDGQHRIEDVCTIAERSFLTDAVVLGVRDFSASEIPFRSRFGNVLTSFLVRRIYKLRIYDTQTGLRAIPRRLFRAFIDIPGDRYEYEMRLFGALHELNERLVQVPIQTIYLENNRASHFRPIRDSIRVYQGLFGGYFFRFCISSFGSFIVDNLIFTLLIYGFNSLGFLRRYDILFSLVIARVASGTFNYFCNRVFVFHSKCKGHISFGRYGLLACFIATLSYVGTAILSACSDADGVAITLIKILVEIGLFVMAYSIQKKWVFKS